MGAKLVLLGLAALGGALIVVGAYLLLRWLYVTDADRQA